MNPLKRSRVREVHPNAAKKLSRRIGLIAFGCILALQPACLFRRHPKAKAPQAPAAAVRIALLPFNIPADNPNLRWVSLAAPLVMAKTIEKSPAFEVVPVWQAYPVALESLGAGRNITPEIAAYVADRVGAKWATNGELTATKDGVWLRVDFIPAKTSLVPYRFEKVMRLDSMGVNAYAAFSQLASYLVLRPLPRFTGKGVTAASIRELAEATDHEYGWFAAADPGKSEKLASGLAKSDSQLARLLFDPILYPVVGSLAGKPKPIELKPVSSQSPEKPDAGAPVPTAPPTQELTQPPPVIQNPPPAIEAPPQAAQAAAPAPAAAQPAVGETKASPQPVAPTPPPTAPAIPQPGPPRKSAPPVSKRPANTPALQSGIPPTVAQTAQVKTGDGTFQIQVYSSQSKQDADATAASLTKGGYSPKVDQVDLKEKGIWYRIRLQGFKTRDEAKAAGDKLVADKVIQQYWLVQ